MLSKSSLKVAKCSMVDLIHFMASFLNIQISKSGIFCPHFVTKSGALWQIWLFLWPKNLQWNIAVCAKTPPTLFANYFSTTQSDFAKIHWRAGYDALSRLVSFLQLSSFLCNHKHSLSERTFWPRDRCWRAQNLLRRFTNPPFLRINFRQV